MIVIEAAAESDLQQIIEIEQEAIAPPWTHGALLGEIYREDSFFAVARFEPRSPPLLGFVILRRMGDDGELLQIAVDKAARRSGVADSLMAAALEFSKETSIGTIFLEVRKTNEAAVGLYKKHGFKTVRTRKDYYSDPVEDAVVMMRTKEDYYSGPVEDAVVMMRTKEEYYSGPVEDAIVMKRSDDHGS